MPYVYSKVDELDGEPLVGSQQCVALVQFYAKLPATVNWKEGESVVGASLIAKGTAIATFVNGKYPNRAHGNHAAFFVSQGAGGIWIVDQWANDPIHKPTILKRFIPRRGKDSSGAYVKPSNNADAFSIIE